MSVCKTEQKKSIISFCEQVSANENFANSCKQIWVRNEQDFFTELAFFRQLNKEEYDRIYGIFFKDGLDYYVTKNSFIANSRLSEYVFSFDNIVIDVDGHDKLPLFSDIDFEVDRLLYTLQNDYKGKFPAFNAVKTGRGIQLWIGLESFSGQLGFLYRGMCHSLCDNLKDILEAEMIPLTIDYKASVNPAGLVRLPYTTNSRRRDFFTAYIHNTDYRYSLDEMLAEFCAIKVSKPKPKHIKGGLLPENNYTALHRKRCAYIKRLQESRHGKCEGCRDKMLFLFYNAAVQFKERAVAVSDTLDLNNSFIEPLKSSEVDSIIRYIDEKGSLRFKPETFLEWLDCSVDERQQYSSTSRDMERRTARANKEQRNKRIDELRKQGVSIRKIAEELKCSKETVRLYLKSKGENQSEQTTPAKDTEVRQRKPDPVSYDCNGKKRFGYDAKCNRWWSDCCGITVPDDEKLRQEQQDERRRLKQDIDDYGLTIRSG